MYKKIYGAFSFIKSIHKYGHLLMVRNALYDEIYRSKFYVDKNIMITHRLRISQYNFYYSVDINYLF